MKELTRIPCNPDIMGGKPCIRGMRLIVRRVVKSVALYPDREELKREFPELDDEDISQAPDYAAQRLDDEGILLGAA